MVLLKEYLCAKYFNVFIPMKQITNTILMIRPVAFRMNEQTKVNNYFQEEDEDNSVVLKKIENKYRTLAGNWPEKTLSLRRRPKGLLN